MSEPIIALTWSGRRQHAALTTTDQTTLCGAKIRRTIFDVPGGSGTRTLPFNRYGTIACRKCAQISEEFTP